MSRVDEILRYWFGDPDDPEMPKGRFDLWFGKADETDREIKDKFAAELEKAWSGEYDDWQLTPDSCIAMIVLLDQFPRNIYRNTPRAFAYDKKALEVCLNGIESGVDTELNLLQRLFFYLPLEHSEDIEMQKLSLKRFDQLLQDAPSDMKETFEMVYNYAVRHHEIIERFGRFPHRNEIFARKSTDEEIEFLKEPDSSF